jgi:predicted AAA+ superfamily ATPase
LNKTAQTSPTVYVAIDEIQRKQDAGRFMKGLNDMGLPYKFILSGSGSLELREQIAESMMGRKREFFISPVTFSEFVDYRTNHAYSDRLAAYAQMEPERLLGHLTEYLNYGGYPRVVVADGQEEKRQVLREPTELGLVFQNLLFHILSEKYPNSPVKYWRTIGQAEVDFVVEDTSLTSVLPVEVKYAGLKQAAITKSMRSFIDKYQPEEAWVINLSLDQAVFVVNTTVRFIPISALL